MADIKLTTGKEVELLTITRRMKRKIEGLAFKAYSDKSYLMEMLLDTVIIATGLTDAEIEEKYTDDEINELANKVSEQVSPTPEQKKS